MTALDTPFVATTHSDAIDVPADIEVIHVLDRYAGWTRRYPVRTDFGCGYAVAKRALDLTGALVLSVLTLPLVLAALAVVKLSDLRAPAIFRQERTGLEGRRIAIRKIRTMVPNADSRRHEVAHLNGRSWPDFKPIADPRVTRVGRFLRATSIDELLQLWSVVAGHMSLVGPRPTSLPASAYQPWQLGRLAVLPGLTGLWQACARDAPSFDDRVRLDLEYVNRRCLRLDLELLVRTIPVVAGKSR